MAEDWAIVEALLGGTASMRKLSTKYLPKWPNEAEDAYEARVKASVLFPAYSRTVDTLTGKPFSKPLTYSDDMPEQMQEWLNDADLQGRNLHACAADVMEKTIGKGIVGVLVDYPRVANVRTVAEEKQTGSRPYIVEIRAEQFIGWRTKQENGKTVLTQFRFCEVVEEDDGDFGVKSVEQIRVLEPFRWEIWRQTDKGIWFKYEEGVTTLDFVPFVPFYGNRKGFMYSRPPMIEMAYMNVQHWQSSSDQQNILHVARVPILTVSGITDDSGFKLTVGASAAVKLPVEGKMEFVEHSGAAIEAGKESLADLEEQMRQAGAELLVIKPGQITATQTSTENAVGMCALNRIVMDSNDAWNQVIDYMAIWGGLGQGNGGTVKIFNDFAAQALQDQSADMLLKACVAGKISDETYITEMKRRGQLAETVSYEEEKERIEAQGPALGSLGSDSPNNNSGNSNE